MYTPNWLISFQRRLFGPQRNAQRRTRQASQVRRSVRLRLEHLEDRITPSTAATAAELQTIIQQDNTNNTADTIQLTGGANDYNLTQLVEITDKNGITLQGKGQTINAYTGNRAFLIDKGGTNVVFQNLTIQGGAPAAGENGGGILDDGGDVTLSHVVLQDNTTTGSGGGIYEDGGSLTIKYSTIQGNKVNSDQAKGGGVYGTNVTIASSTLSGNQLSGTNTAQGAGAYLDGDSKLVNTTVAENNASGLNLNGNLVAGEGGGLYFNAGKASLTNVTVVGNIAGSGGGIDTNSGANPTVSLLNTLVANNLAPTAPDFLGGVSDQGHNLIGSTSGVTGSGFNGAGDHLNVSGASMGTLANNGGPTQTVEVFPPSPAVNGGDNSALSILGQFDQRGAGFPRNSGGTVDIGAYEYQTPPASPPPASPPSSPPSENQPPAPHPSLFQALISLFIDGAYLEAVNTYFNEGMGDASYSVGAEQASEMLVENIGLFRHFDTIDYGPSLADIAANLPYAGPFGQYAVIAGVQAAEQFIQDAAARNPQMVTFQQQYEELSKTSPIGVL